MKKLVLGLVMALGLVSPMVEAKGLPVAVSRNMAAKQITVMNPYVQRNTKYTSSEWGSSNARNLKILPVNFHPYIAGRVGF
jgi:hypothetical protein